MKLFKYTGFIFSNKDLFSSTGLPNAEGLIKVTNMGDYSVTFETPKSFTELFTEL